MATWLDGPQTELLYDEIDLAHGGRFERRENHWPTAELSVGRSGGQHRNR